MHFRTIYRIGIVVWIHEMLDYFLELNEEKYTNLKSLEDLSLISHYILIILI